MSSEPMVVVRHLSLFPEPDESPRVREDGPVVLPWHTAGATSAVPVTNRGVDETYLRYLEERPDSVLGALDLIARSPGATVVHCAAGKDRTGVVIAIALTEIGVPREVIVEDYVLSADRLAAVFARLRARRTYAGDLVGDEPFDVHQPRPEIVSRLLAAVDREHGGVSAWLRQNGWTDRNAEQLRHRLLG
jgi:hypothetical protein